MDALDAADAAAGALGSLAFAFAGLELPSFAEGATALLLVSICTAAILSAFASSAMRCTRRGFGR